MEKGVGGGFQTYQIKIHIVKENNKNGSEHPPPPPPFETKLSLGPPIVTGKLLFYMH